MITLLAATYLVDRVSPMATARRFSTIKFLAGAAFLFFLPPLIEVPPVAGLFGPLSFSGVLLQAAVINAGNLHKCSVARSTGLSVPRCAASTGSGKRTRTGCGYLLLSKFVPLAGVDEPRSKGVPSTGAIETMEAHR